jgi:hypothetical protein
LRAVAEQDPTVLVASAKRVAVLVEMEIKMDRQTRAEQTQPQIQGQEVAAVVAITGRCMAAQVAQAL